MNDKGRVQADKCGAYLAKSEWGLIITSPLKRALETAEIIHSYLGSARMGIMDEFTEREYGMAEGMTFEEKKAAYPDKAYPGKEEKWLFENRIMDGLRQLENHSTEKRIILVTHGAVIRTLHDMLAPGGRGTIRSRLHNACLSKIEFHLDSWNMCEYNQTAHLG